MKITALEEHFAKPEILAAWQALVPELQDVTTHASATDPFRLLLCDLADERLRAMDETLRKRPPSAATWASRPSQTPKRPL